MVNSAGVPRVATTKPANRQPAASPKSVHLVALHRVTRTTGVKPATRTEQRRNQHLVKADTCDRQVFHRRRSPSFRLTTCIPDSTSEKTTSVAPRLAIQTMSQPGGKSLRRRRNASRTRRLMRLRRTALPTFRVTVTPIRVGASSSPRVPSPELACDRRRVANTKKCRVWTRVPRPWTRRNSGRRRIRQ